MGFKRFAFTRLWTRAEDFPAMESDEAQVREDMQCLHDETKAGLNGLIEELEHETAAEMLGAKGAEGEKTTVQRLFERLHLLLQGIVEVTKVLGEDDTTIPTSKAVSDAIKFSAALPAGGEPGQTLAKASAENYDTQWQNVPGDRVGDVRTTLRTDLGEQWVLCDGSLRDKTGAPELWPMLSEIAARRELARLPVSSYQTKKIYGKNALEISSVENQFDTLEGLGRIGYCDLDTGAVVSVEAGACSCTNAGRMNGRLYGIDWNGQEWIMCLGVEDGLSFFASRELREWTHKKTLTELEIVANSEYGGVCRFLFDGQVYRVTGQYSGYQSGRMVTISNDLTAVGGIVGLAGAMQMIDGVTFVINSSGTLLVFEQGSAKQSAVSGGNVGAAGIVTRFDENRFVIWPARGYENTNRVCLLDRRTNTMTEVVPDQQAEVLCAPYVDQEKLVFVGKSNAELSYFNRRIYLPLGADPGQKENYTAEPIPDAQLDGVQEKLVKLQGQGLYTDDGQYYEVIGAALYTCGPRWRPLPEIRQKDADCYIKERSGE